MTRVHSTPGVQSEDESALRVASAECSLGGRSLEGCEVEVEVGVGSQASCSSSSTSAESGKRSSSQLARPPPLSRRGGRHVMPSPCRYPLERLPPVPSPSPIGRGKRGDSLLPKGV